MSALSNSAAASESPNLKRKANIPGIKDAGKVDEFLYRGAQPSEKGLKELREMGVNTIIDLRDEWPVGGKERTQICAIARHEFCQLTGERMVPAIRPTGCRVFQDCSGAAQTANFCPLGGDRSGVFIAVYRIAFDRWTPEAAIQEMHAYHFKAFLHPNLTAYVRSFPQRLARSSSLASFRHLASQERKTPIR